jgi:hypothetical protein
MLSSLNRILRSPDTQAAPSGGHNGAAPAATAAVDPRGVLAAMVAQQDLPTSPEPESPAPVSAMEAPAAEPVPPTDPEPGQENLPAENQPPAEPEPPADEPTEPDPSIDPEDDPAKPASNPNVQKRIDALTRQKSELATENETLKAKVAELEGGARSASGPTSLPPTVAKLKTVAECESRLAAAQANMETIQDFLDANPGDATTEYNMGEKTVTRQELIESRKAWREEIRSLPQHAQTLAQQAQFAQTQTATRREVLTAFPYLDDPEHALTKAVAGKLKEAPFLKSFASPEYAALVWVKGELALKAEQAARAKPATAPRPAGAVPARKPMTASAAPSRPDTQTATLKSALALNGKSGSKSSFADVIAQSGR